MPTGSPPTSVIDRMEGLLRAREGARVGIVGLCVPDDEASTGILWNVAIAVGAPGRVLAEGEAANLASAMDQALRKARA